MSDQYERVTRRVIDGLAEQVVTTQSQWVWWFMGGFFAGLVVGVVGFIVGALMVAG